ncbi:hypothetical protein GCM10008927_15320 [Amylibacter ulvae]|uniref:YARHG domain-containing protein n=1 Tax=Paramylibacter ulvae TaxID=1651968 RepID=A0ABQ3D167_9RHOB|nr:hypothetical protein GCM10008927_15320 [Amylibacter ulvae]
MKQFYVLISLVFFAAPTWAQSVCDDLWLSRNVIYDAHGYCFGSELGKAIFDNNGCTSVDPTLPPDLQDRIKRIWTQDRSLECAVDQSQTNINVYNQAARLRLLTQPIATEDNVKVCFGAQPNNPIVLHKDKTDTSPVLATIDTGDTLGWLHLNEGDWQFITLMSKSTAGKISSGWTDQAGDLRCDEIAG